MLATSAMLAMLATVATLAMLAMLATGNASYDSLSARNSSAIMSPLVRLGQDWRRSSMVVVAPGSSEAAGARSPSRKSCRCRWTKRSNMPQPVPAGGRLS